MADWYTANSAKAVDKNLATQPEPLFSQIVDVAREQVLEYAPVLAEGAEIPTRYVLAQLMQIQALVKAQKAGPGDVTGPDGYTVRVFPMDWNIRNVIRPKSAGPQIG